jgi:hypothetical protein
MLRKFHNLLISEPHKILSNDRSLTGIFEKKRGGRDKRGEPPSGSPFVRSGCLQAAFSAVILWPMEVWTSNVRISGPVSSKGVSISWILGNCSWW